MKIAPLANFDILNPFSGSKSKFEIIYYVKIVI